MINTHYDPDEALRETKYYMKKSADGYEVSSGENITHGLLAILIREQVKTNTMLAMKLGVLV